jgi:SAM-dependent methyltransferase
MSRTFDEAPLAEWHRTMGDQGEGRIEEVQRRIREAAAQSQYGWGHTIDFGPFTQEGLLADTWLRVAGTLDELDMWPRDLTGLRVADVGAFTGGISVLLADRGAEAVYAVDEIPGHVAQTRVLVDAFGVLNLKAIESSLYHLDRHIPEESLDLILLSGVLYHLSDMLVGIYALRRLLKPQGRLVIETNAVEDMDHSYANFGRYYAGMWWQPTMLCVQDMLEFMGFADVRVEPFVSSRCVASGVRSEDPIPFTRGLNWDFGDRRDAVQRTLDEQVMAPAPVIAEATPEAPRKRILRRRR